MRGFRSPPIPPPHAYKVATVLGYARRFEVPALIETGTYHGDMVEAVRPYFERVWSIELGDELHAAAARRFSAWPSVTIIHGDSGVVLRDLAAEVSGPCLFWLDGHFSAGVTARGDVDTPIVAELDSVLGRSGWNDVVLIDDARLFGQGDYPSLSWIQQRVADARPGWRFQVRDDIIRAHRPEGSALSV